MPRGQSPQSKENLAKGRAKGIKRNRPVGIGGMTWKELIVKYGETEPPEQVALEAGLTPSICAELGLKKPTWKAVRVAMMFRDSSPLAWRELMDRSDGKVKDELEVTNITFRVVEEDGTDDKEEEHPETPETEGVRDLSGEEGNGASGEKVG